MLTHFFTYDLQSTTVPKEGDIYKTLQIYGEQFVLPYGYYEDCERKNPAVDPMPIYPDFRKKPQYTKEGFPFVTKMQDACEHYVGEYSRYADCAECRFYSHGEDLIGICACLKNRKTNGG